MSLEQEQLKKYQKAAEINPDFADIYADIYIEWYIEWGNALGKLKRYEKAIEKYQKAIEINPGSAEAYNNWGVALDNLKRYEEAIEKYQKATEINPDSAKAYNNWGFALDNLKRYEEAIEKYQKAREINLDSAEAYNNWGECLFNRNRYEEAIKKYQKAIEVNPDYAEAYTSRENAQRQLKQAEDLKNKISPIQATPEKYEGKINSSKTDNFNTLDRVDKFFNLLKLLNTRKQLAKVSIVVAIIWAILIPFNLKNANNLSNNQSFANHYQELFSQVVSIVFAISMSALVSTYVFEAYLDDKES